MALLGNTVMNKLLLDKSCRYQPESFCQY